MVGSQKCVTKCQGIVFPMSSGRIGHLVIWPQYHIFGKNKHCIWEKYPHATVKHGGFHHGISPTVLQTTFMFW